MDLLSLAELPLAAPALPLDEAGKYVAGAYIVFLVLLVVYLAIIGTRVGRMEKELKELATFAEARQTPDMPAEGTAPDGTVAESTDPGRGSEDQSISVSSGPRGSRGGGA